MIEHIEALDGLAELALDEGAAREARIDAATRWWDLLGVAREGRNPADIRPGNPADERYERLGARMGPIKHGWLGLEIGGAA